jgi:hypothetical protein
MLNIFKNSIVTKSCKFSLYALKFIWIDNRNRVPCNISILSLDETKAKYSIIMLSGVEKER